MKTMILSMLLALTAAVALTAPSSPLVAVASAAESQEATVALHVDGMTCASCSLTVRVTLERLDGVSAAVVSVKDKRAQVTYDPTKVTPKQMVDVVNSAGYLARVAAEREG